MVCIPVCCTQGPPKEKEGGEDKELSVYEFVLLMIVPL